jgi:hypothetical protein
MNVLWILLPFFLLGAGVGLFVVVYYRTLRALWREPVLKHPVLIIESDDWGPAPTSDVQVLERLIRLLSKHWDSTRQPAVMTLGVVLAIPDGARIRDNGLRQYHRQTLEDERFQPLRHALSAGVREGVFSLQLHGMEHFWPESVMAAAQDNDSLRKWLDSDMPIAADLPDALQSRWCDASVLPSRELDAATVRQAAIEEVRMFSQIFGQIASVAVPPTFIWNDAVEEGWAKAGVQVVISPGRRLNARDGTGRPVGPNPSQPDGLHLNGMRTRHGQTYLIRNAWFEPLRGHTAEQAIDTLKRHTLLGRPVLFETHRSNFVGEGPGVEGAFDELDSLFSRALKLFPDLRFCASDKLAKYLNRMDAHWVECGFQQHLSVFLRRVLAHQSFHRMAVLTGTLLVARVGLWLSILRTRWQTA